MSLNQRGPSRLGIHQMKQPKGWKASLRTIPNVFTTADLSQAAISDNLQSKMCAKLRKGQGPQHRLVTESSAGRTNWENIFNLIIPISQRDVFDQLPAGY